MRKTSIYLSNEEAEHLRRLAAVTGRSQADLVREGLRAVLAQGGAGLRTFHSLGHGHGGGAAYTGWTSDELYRRRTGGG